MIGKIDYDRRLSPEEHCLLFVYALSHGERKMNYQEFEITEELIDRYNRASDHEKQTIESSTHQLPRYSDFLKAFQARPWEYEKPVLWSDREKTPYFIQQLKRSHAFEVYIDHLFRGLGVDIGLYYGRDQQYHKGETAVGIEIKYDKKSTETGNYYIEYQERMRAGASWVNSGILKEDATRFYLLGTLDGFVIFERGWLMDYYRRLVVEGERLPDAKLVREQAHETSKGFILKPAAWNRGNIPMEQLVKEYL